MAASLLGCAILVLPVYSQAAPSASKVDLTPVITIDDYSVSRYLFEKAYHQFVGPLGRPAAQKAEQELDRWFRLYLAQQLVKADLVRENYLNKPEVIDLTERMTRYMLTQPHGPLYRVLAGSGDVSSFRRERRARILRESQFSAPSDPLEHLWNAIAPAFERGTLPAEADVAGIGSEIIATYTRDGQTRRITALDFVQDFRQGIARPGPRDAKMLEQQVEDIVVAEYDLAEAKRLQIDRTPQFLQDQRNFALNQALALYEQEVLYKQISISRDDLLASYQATSQRYVSPKEIIGELSVYSSLATAQQALNAANNSMISLTVPMPEKFIAPFILRRDEDSALHGAPYNIIATVPNDRSCGPFDYEGKHVIFTKRRVGQLTPRPFEQVEADVQRQLVRQKVEALELQRLDRESARLQLDLDFASYGLPKIQLQGLSR